MGWAMKLRLHESSIFSASGGLGLRAEVRRQIEAPNRRRSSLLDELETLLREQHAYKPTLNRWSILQIVEHLVLAKREVLGHLSKGRKRAVV